nr:hypothetical protein [Propionibacterium sp.]
MKGVFPNLAGQHGLATRAQLRVLGWGNRAIARWGRTVGQQAYPGVFAAHNGPLDRGQLIAGAALWAGHRALLTGVAALELRGFCPPGEATILRFLVMAPAWCARAGDARIVRTRRPLPQPDYIGCIPVAPFERALLDAARYREFSRLRVRALTIKALQGGWVTPEALIREIQSGRRNETRAVRLGVRDFLRGAWSLPEVWLAKVVSAAGLPPMLVNPELRTPSGQLIGVPDGYFDAAGVAVQVHSREFHSGEDADGADRWSRTVERDGDYAAHGVLVVGVAPRALRDAPARFLQQVASAIASRQGRPPPDVVVCRRQL